MNHVDVEMVDAEPACTLLGRVDRLVETVIAAGQLGLHHNVVADTADAVIPIPTASSLLYLVAVSMRRYPLRSAVDTDLIQGRRAWRRSRARPVGSNTRC